jgi:hypothetical protein
MSKNILKVALLNFVIFPVFIILYLVTGFLSGYGANNSYEADAWWLFLGFLIAHLFINSLLLRRFKVLNFLGILLTCFEILILYGIAAWHCK